VIYGAMIVVVGDLFGRSTAHLQPPAHNTLDTCWVAPAPGDHTTIDSSTGTHCFFHLRASSVFCWAAL